MANTVEVVSLIYKSKSYLDFVIAQLKKWAAPDSIPGWEVKCRIVANDPTKAVMDHLRSSGFPYSEYRDPCPNHYYMDRVYRAHNWCVRTSDCDHICLINSDMAFSPGWLANLLKHHDGVNIPCSRLVESGRLISGEPQTISRNFGRDPTDFDEVEWLKYAEETKADRIEINGTFMPVVLSKERFLEAGGYPEGNIYGEPGAYYTGHKDRGHHVPSAVWSGDFFFFRKTLAEKFGMKQITVFDSLVYHTQSGEMYWQGE